MRFECRGLHLQAEKNLKLIFFNSGKTVQNVSSKTTRLTRGADPHHTRRTLYVFRFKCTWCSKLVMLLMLRHDDKNYVF